MNQTNQTANQLLSNTVPDCTWNPPSNPSSTAPAHPRFPQLVREWDLFFEHVIIFNIRNHIPGRLFPIFQTEALPLRVEGNAKTRLYTNVLMPINALLGTQGAIFDETIPGFLGIPDYVLCTNAGNNNPAVAKMSVEIKTRHNLNLGRYDLWDICRYADRAQISDTTFKFKKRILSQAFGEMACNGLHYGILTNYSDTYFFKRPETEPTTLYASHVVHPYHVAPTLRECVYYISHLSINDNVGNRLDRVMEDNVSSYDDDDGDDNDDDDGDDNDDDFSDNGFDDDYVPDNGDSSDNDDGSKKRKSSSSGKKKVVASSSKGITTIDNYIGGGTFGKVFSGKYHDQVVAWKTCDAYKEQEAMKMLKHEAHIYSILKEIQGNSIPCLLYEGYIYDGYLYTLALHLIEDARHIDPAILTIEEKESIVKQLESIHSFGVLHNDIAPRNILFEPKSHKYFFVDFGLSEIVGNESPKLRKEERRLKKFLQL